MTIASFRPSAEPGGNQASSGVQKGSVEPGDERYVRFIVRLAWALHRYGAPAHRLEDVLRSLADRVGMPAQFLSMPTAFFAAFGPWDAQRTFLVRIDPGDVDLHKQVLLDELAESVAEGRLAPEDGLRRVELVVAARPRYGPVLTAVCAGIAAGAASRFFGGGEREIVASTVVGTMIGVLSMVLGRKPATSRVFEPVAALLASVAVPLIALAIGPLQTSIAVLGGLIALVPGLSVTTAMNELATRHLVSGTGRLFGAMSVFLVLGLGVTLGTKISQFLPGTAADTVAIALPPWTEVAGLLGGLASFCVLFRVPPREAPWAIGAGCVVHAAARFGIPVLGPDLGVGFAALLLGGMANLYARLRRRPAAIALVPALMLLVPGSIGFRSLLSLIEKNVLSGVETAFQMTMVAVSLVTGLVLANVVVSPRRAL